MRADARRNQAKVLDAARAAFASEGLAVPLDEIARRAGVGAGTVHRHYPTKESLFEAVVLGVLESLRDEGQALARASDPGEAFFSFLTRLIEQGTEDKALFDAMSGTGGELQAACATASEELSQVLTTLLKRAQKARAVRPDISQADVKALLVGALAAQSAHVPGSSPARVAVVACDGLRPTASSRPSVRG